VFAFKEVDLVHAFIRKIYYDEKYCLILIGRQMSRDLSLY
jgi:hypothetical protein